MTESILDKYAARMPADDAANSDGEQLEDFGSFGYLRGLHDRALFLELRFTSGDLLAFPYSMLARVEFNRSRGVTLHFAGAIVRIIGQNLDAEPRPGLRLLTGILRQRITWIQEQVEFHTSGSTQHRLSVDRLVVE